MTATSQAPGVNSAHRLWGIPQSRLRTALEPLGAVMLSVLLWWAVTASYPPQSLLHQTSPVKAAAALAGLVRRGVLLPDVSISLWRLVIGLLVAVVVGVPLGLVLGLNKRVERATTPLVQFARMITPLSWTPIAVAVFGIGSQPVIFLIAAAAVWPVVVNTVAGVHAIDPGHVELARSFHATGVEMLVAVVLPAVRTHVLTGLRLALGVAWIVLVPAEMLGVRSGLGYQILNARDQLAYDQVAALIVVVGALGWALDAAARTVLRSRR